MIILNSTPDINAVAGSAKVLRIKTAVKIKTKVPGAVYDYEQELITEAIESNVTANAKTVVRVGAPVQVNDNITAASEKLAADSSIATNTNVATNKDTAITTATSKSETKKNNPKWQYGIRVASGFGALKKDLFGNKALFTADAVAFNNTAGVPPPVQIGSKPNNPATGLVFNAGFFAQKEINTRWSFIVGFNYAYQSNITKVGIRVDTVATFRFDVRKSLSADNYYKIGDDINYKNKFHLIEVPLLFQWRLSRKLPVYFEGGPTVGYLASSNALVYNSNSSAYFTDAAVFNKLLLSFTAGAGINLAQKKKLPFSIGYQFSYTASSATKTAFGKQHLVNSMLYVKIPFKK
jgi:hypothetical protein